MPTTAVDDRGSVLYYEDSGTPPGSNGDYTTLVLVHGAGFHGATFRRLSPFTAERKLRLVTLNLRDYPGSTPYTQEELNDLRGPSHERQERALRARALELGAFLRWLIQCRGIPPIRVVADSGARQGGISLIAWSAANCQTMALLAHADQLPEETRTLLDTHLRSYVLYEPSLASAGGTVPEELRGIRATREPSMSLDGLASAFCLSASAYYAPFTLPQALDPLPTYAPRTPLHDQPGLAEPNSKHTPTTLRMTPAELRETLHPQVMDTDGSQNLLRILNPDVYRANVESALFDRRFAFGNTLEEVWPSLRVHVIWCDMSVGDCIWASVLLHFKHAGAQPESRRPLALHKLEGANHFVHWEEPERRRMRIGELRARASRYELVTGRIAKDWVLSSFRSEAHLPS